MCQKLRNNLIRTTLIGLTLLSATTCNAMSYLSSLFNPQTTTTAQDQLTTENFLSKKADLLEAERYHDLDNIVDNDLKGSIPSDFLDWIYRQVEQKKDRWCMFRYIRNSAALKYNRATFGSEYFKQTMVYMVAHLILITEDIAGLISLPHQDTINIINSYTRFRDLYKNWYENAFKSERIDFNEVKDLAIAWLATKDKIANPCPYWIVGTKKITPSASTQESRPLDNIIFTNVDPDDIVLCEAPCITKLFAESQQASLKEVSDILDTITSWDVFFKHDFYSLNRANIASIRHIPQHQPSEKDSKVAAVAKASQPTSITVASVSASSSMGSSASHSASSNSAASSTASKHTSASTARYLPSTPSQPKIGLNALGRSVARSRAHAAPSTETTFALQDGTQTHKETLHS